MTLQAILKDRQMSIYRLAKESQVPYATCNDIVSGKARIEKCSAETVYRLSHALGISMEALLIHFEQDYPGATKEENADTIVQSPQQKASKAEILSQLRKCREQVGE